MTIFLSVVGGVVVGLAIGYLVIVRFMREVFGGMFR